MLSQPIQRNWYISRGKNLNWSASTQNKIDLVSQSEQRFIPYRKQIKIHNLAKFKLYTWFTVLILHAKLAYSIGRFSYWLDNCIQLCSKMGQSESLHENEDCIFFTWKKKSSFTALSTHVEKFPQFGGSYSNTILVSISLFESKSPFFVQCSKSKQSFTNCQSWAFLNKIWHFKLT